MSLTPDEKRVHPRRRRRRKRKRKQAPLEQSIPAAPIPLADQIHQVSRLARLLPRLRT